MATLLLVSHPVSRRASLFLAAAFVSCLWSAACAALLIWAGALPLRTIAALDCVHLLLWIACVFSWRAAPSAGGWLVVTASASGLWVLLMVVSVAVSWFGTAPAVLALLALIGTVASLQVLLSARPDQRARIWLLCLSVAGFFAFDFVVYAQTAWFGAPALVLWETRGLANALLAGGVMLAIARPSKWDTELFVSRQAVFYSASLIGLGAYVLMMGSLAHFIRVLGADWTPLREGLFLLVAFGLPLPMLFSTQGPSRLGALVVKHLYRDRYDYREEWLRLTQSLGNTPQLGPLITNALKGLARIVGSQQGELWLSRDLERYEWMASIDRRFTTAASLDRANPTVKFLASHGWVIDSQEYEREPERYGSSFGDPAHGALPRESLIVPLECLGQLQGFVVLQRPPALRSLNFEDHDILKTAGKQIAVVLAQALAQERLAETRQFEVMNKLSTFLMHDLKNIVAQQELVIANAQRFRHRPEFIEDAFATIRGGVERMKKVLEHLRSATQAETNAGRVDVSRILMEVRSQCGDREPVPKIELAQQPAWVAMDRDKLTAVMTHLIRNSQDATPADGKIDVRLENGGDQLLVTVADTGCGMDAAFIRDHLFRPFDSTKGSKGMGIGVYQVRHLVRSVGGDVEVSSEPGVGTTFRLRLPVAKG
jgi:putative PEP-CTERM system histidine kinase